jgi:SAM-dependent methyltransferase
VLEVGPGTGQATGDLLDLGAAVTAVELGAALAARLVERFGSRAQSVVVGAFEDVDLEARAFDAVVAATSFHWVPTERGLAQAARALEPSGTLALWWTVFADPERADPFGDELGDLLARVAPELLGPERAGTAASESGAGPNVPYAMDLASRTAELERSGAFGAVRTEVVPWTARPDLEGLRALFGSFSPWLAIEPERREVLLEHVVQLASHRFGGVVERPYRTVVYLATRLG